MASLLGWGAFGNWFGLVRRRPEVRTSIAILGFEGLPGNAENSNLSEAFTSGLAAELRIGRDLRVVSGERIARLALVLKLNSTKSYSSHVLSLIRENTGADLVAWGRYTERGVADGNGAIRLEIAVKNAATGKTATSIQCNGGANDLAALLSGCAAQIRAKLELPGLSTSEQRFARPVLPASSEVLALYATGLRDLYTWKYETASGLFQEAIAKEPSYAPAHAGLARALAERGYTQPAISEIRDALNLSHELPREQKLLIEGEYYEIESEWSKALDAYRNLFKLYPDDIDYALSTARLENGTEALRTLAALRRPPASLPADPRIDSLKAKIEIDLRDYAAARLAAEAAAIKARELSAQAVLANALVLQASAERMLGLRQRAAALFRQGEHISGMLGDRATETDCMQSLAAIYIDAGELSAASATYAQALAIGRSVQSLRIVASSSSGLGHVRLQEGNLAQARQFLSESLNLMRQQQSVAEIPIQETYLGELFLRRGELGKAHEFTQDALNALANTRGRSEVEALANFARIQVEAGRIDAASQSASEALQIANGLKDQYSLASILLTAGDIARSRGSLSKARAQYAKGLAAFSKLGLNSGIAEARLRLAGLDLVVNNASSAASLAHEALLEFEREGRMSGAYAARALQAQAELLQRHLTTAEAILRPARQRRIQDHLVADLVNTTAARVTAAAGHPAKAIAELNGLIADTSRLGLVRDRLEAELALAAVDPNFNSSKLASEASHHGFIEIASRARDFRRSQ